MYISRMYRTAICPGVPVARKFEKRAPKRKKNPDFVEKKPKRTQKAPQEAERGGGEGLMIEAFGFC
jgi:hypothetical protein